LVFLLKAATEDTVTAKEDAWNTWDCYRFTVRHDNTVHERLLCGIKNNQGGTVNLNPNEGWTNSTVLKIEKLVRKDDHVR
jgi:hypothetical protein